MKAITCAAAVTLLAVFAYAPDSSATLLRGSTVYGTLNIDGSPVNEFGSNPAKVGPGIEFNYTDETFQFSSGVCEYTANLSNAKIAIGDVCTGPITEIAAVTPDLTKNGHAPFVLTLTDTAFANDPISAINNGLGLDFSLLGDTLTFDFAGGNTVSNRSTFAVTPEPASWQLLALGLAGVLCFGRFARSRSLEAVSGTATF